MPLVSKISDDRDEDSKSKCEGFGEDDSNSKILTGKKLFLTFAGMLLSTFLTALDQTVLGPAIPVIASEFNALDKMAWVFTSFFITQLSSLLLYGQILTIFSQKRAFLLAISIFTAGSLLCGIARNLITLILGRAISGAGAGGIVVSCLSIIAEVTKLEDRPKLFASFGAVFGVSSVCGPLLGGAITDHIGWRWCFWCNLPVGAIAFATNFLFLSSKNASTLSKSLHERADDRWRKLSFGNFIPTNDSFWHKLATLDFIGAGLISAAITPLVLALQWGGNEYPWGDKAVIIPLVGAFVFAILFFAWESLGMGKNCEGALIPLRLFKNRTQIGATIQCVFLTMNFFIPIYFLPIHFQAIKNSTATKSGLQLIPLMLSVVFANASSGFFVSATGYYFHPMILGPVLLAISSGLMSTFDEHTKLFLIFIYEIIGGTGFGLLIQNSIFAVQANVAEKDVPQASGVVSFGKLFGSVLGVTIAQAIFENFLVKGLNKYLTIPNSSKALPGIPPIKLLKSSVSIIYKIPDQQIRLAIIKSYVFALKRVYLAGVPFAIAALLATFLIKNRNIKQKDENSVKTEKEENKSSHKVLNML